MRLLLRYGAGMARRSRRTIREGIRQIVALLLTFALQGASLPADSLSSASTNAPHERSSLMFVPPGGLNGFPNTAGFHRWTAPQAEKPKSVDSYTSLGPEALTKSMRPSVGATGGSARVVPFVSPAQLNASGQNTSTITSNFNGTSIAAGDSIWFNSVMKVSGVPSAGATITVSGATVQFTANNVSYDLPVPDAVIAFSSSASTSTTIFDAVHNQWNTTVPVSYSGNVFLAGLSEYLSAALPGGINPVNWTATFYSDTAGADTAVAVGGGGLHVVQRELRRSGCKAHRCHQRERLRKLGPRGDAGKLQVVCYWWRPRRRGLELDRLLQWHGKRHSAGGDESRSSSQCGAESDGFHRYNGAIEWHGFLRPRRLAD